MVFLRHMKTLSIVIPVYNEEDRLYKTFKAFSELQLPRGLKLEKVIFVDDGSTDNTKRIIERFIASSTVGRYSRFLHRPRSPRRDGATSEVSLALISYKKNCGKGYAIAQGMKESESDYTLFCDADMSTHVTEVRKLVPFMKKNIPIIIGTRKNGHSTVVRHQPLYRELLGRGFTLLSNIILNIWASDFTCGFKAFSHEAKDALFPQLRLKGWSFDAELLFLGRISGFQFAEVPVIWSDDRRSKVNLLVDIPKSFIDLFYVRLISFANPAKPAFSFLKTIKSFLF